MPGNRPKTFNADCSRLFSGDVSLDEFLRDYWQQKPLLIRNAFPDLISPLSAEELAGLACEEDVNSRIVIEEDAEQTWKVKYSPFEEQTFETFPETHWTLLVNDVEKHAPQTRKIKDCFRFIPDWRIDDLMFSYAPEGGSVGPHVDAYDVFLLQVSGRRNWMIANSHENQFLENTELSILSSFTADKSWILEPGDMLYLPPGIAHHGIATEDCITCSIGFRAPSVRAIVSEYAEHIANNMNKDLRYTDPNLSLQSHPAEISLDSIKTFKSLLNQHLTTENDQIQLWLGHFMTDTGAGIQAVSPENSVHSFDEFESLFKNNKLLLHSPASKFLFSNCDDYTLLFVDGHSYNVSRHFAETICAHYTLKQTNLTDLSLSTQDKKTLTTLFNLGCLYFSNESE